MPWEMPSWRHKLTNGLGRKNLFELGLSADTNFSRFGILPAVLGFAAYSPMRPVYVVTHGPLRNMIARP
jgi:hypothetical protein